MAQHTLFLDGVKEVLEDKEKMEKVDSHGSQETKQLFGERKIKWRLENLIENGEYEKKALIRLPDDMKNLFGDHETQNGSVSMDILKAKVCNDMKMT